MDIAEFGLPYWKQGDDLHLYLEDCDSIGEALELHAQAMDAAAAKLRELKATIEGHDVVIYADCHHIEVDGDDELIRKLVEQELVELRPGCDDEDVEGSNTESAIDWLSSGF